MPKERIPMTREFVDGAGIYAFYPFDNLDKHGKGVFKIGMTASQFHKRISGYHTYLPQGVYMKCFLKNPTKLIENYNTTESHRTYYQAIERDIFNDIKSRGGEPIWMAIREKNEGFTEWIYASEKMIEQSFRKAQRKWGGRFEDANLEQGISENIKQLKKDSFFKGEIYFV